MGCPTEVHIDDDLVFSICTHDPDTGQLTDADALPIYRIYEAETATPILTGTMALLDAGTTTGFYTELINCTAANGFENGKSYTIYIQATVDADTGGISYGFRALPAPNDPTAAAIADAVWDEGKAAHNNEGSFGQEVMLHALSTEISALDDPSAADVADAVWDEAAADHDAAGSFGEDTQAHALTTQISALNDPSAADVADAVWDEDIVAAHNTADTAGALLDDLATPASFKADVSALATAAAVSALNDPTAGDVADAVWDEAAADHVAAGSTGKVLSTIGAGSGATAFVYTLTSTIDSSPIPDADVWVTTDIAGTATIASGRTSALGKVTFYLNSGTYYFWRQKAGWTFTNPDTEVVS